MKGMGVKRKKRAAAKKGTIAESCDAFMVKPGNNASCDSDVLAIKTYKKT